MTKKHVTDEQLGKLTRRGLELVDRVRSGALPYDEVMESLQALLNRPRASGSDDSAGSDISDLTPHNIAIVQPASANLSQALQAVQRMSTEDIILRWHNLCFGRGWRMCDSITTAMLRESARASTLDDRLLDPWQFKSLRIRFRHDLETSIRYHIQRIRTIMEDDRGDGLICCDTRGARLRDEHFSSVTEWVVIDFGEKTDVLHDAAQRPNHAGDEVLTFAWLFPEILDEMAFAEFGHIVLDGIDIPGDRTLVLETLGDQTVLGQNGKSWHDAGVNLLLNDRTSGYTAHEGFRHPVIVKL